MEKQKRLVSPGINKLVPVELQDYLWKLHSKNPYLPSIFDLSRGRAKTVQKVLHICLYPSYFQEHSFNISNPLHDLRITILQVETGLLMRLSNKELEVKLSQSTTNLEQGELF